MKIRPLTGQVLVEILPADKVTAGGIEIPDRVLSPEEVQSSHRNPQKPPAIMGRVVEIGPWRKLPNGLAVLPEFSKGSRVIIGHNSGVAMKRGISDRLRMVPQASVLAIVTECREH